MFPDEAGDVEVTETQSSTQSAETASTVVPASAMLDDEFYIGSPRSTTNTDADPVSVTARRVAYDETMAEAEQPKSNKMPQIPDEMLRTIRDDVIGVHSPESDAYFLGLKLALRAEQKKFDKPAKGAFALFMDSPNGARGKPYYIEGKLRRLASIRGRANSYEIGALFDAWISTVDSGDQLVHVVLSKAEGSLASLLPKNTPNPARNFDITNSPEVRLIGYFFKIEGYPTEMGGISRAPLLLAGTLRTIPPPEATTNRAAELTPYLAYLALIICASVLLMIFRFAISDAAYAQTRAHQLTKLPAVASFEDVSSMSVVESLSELEFANSEAEARSTRLN